MKLYTSNIFLIIFMENFLIVVVVFCIFFLVRSTRSKINLMNRNMNLN